MAYRTNQMGALFVQISSRHPRLRRPGPAGFSLVEMLVATTILVIIVGILFVITQQTTIVWKNTTGKAEVFRSARAAFDTMTRTISQATLNTYYDYATVTSSSYTFVSGGTTLPSTYARNSSLQIVAGLNSSGQSWINGSSGGYTPVTHGIFFQAPLGISNVAPNGKLNGLLNSCGFYIVYGPDPAAPAYASATPKYRYRLMEFLQPTESFSVYGNTGSSGSWFANAINTDLSASTQTSNFVLADNVIALIILPKLSANDEKTAETNYGLNTTTYPLGTALAPNYTYDSTTLGQGGTIITSGASIGKTTYPLLNSFNQLPPVFQVTMIAIDEASAQRVCTTSVAPNSKLGLPSGFTKLFCNATGHTAASFSNDMTTVETALKNAKVKYRVFQTDVAIRGAKWTSD